MVIRSDKHQQNSYLVLSLCLRIIGRYVRKAKQFEQTKPDGELILRTQFPL